MDETNCEKCRYRIWLTKYGETPVYGKDCDQYGTDFCKKMNDPGFIKFMEDRNVQNMR